LKQLANLSAALEQHLVNLGPGIDNNYLGEVLAELRDSES